MLKTKLPVLIIHDDILLPQNEIKLDFDNNLDKQVLSLSENYFNNYLFVLIDDSIIGETLPMYGVVAQIRMKLDLPNGKLRITLKGIRRGKALKYNYDNGIYDSEISSIDDININPTESIANVRVLRELFNEYLDNKKSLGNSILSQLDDINDIDVFTDTVSGFMELSNDRKKSYLYEIDPLKRSLMLKDDLGYEISLLTYESSLDDIVSQKLEDSQREFILREKLKVINEELGVHEDSDLEKIIDKFNNLDAPEHVKKRLEEEINRYRLCNSNSPEVGLLRNYIDTLLSLPWNISTKDNTNIKDIRKILNESHYGLDDAKERILEYIATKKYTKSNRNPIICLVGPPGIGKTSIAKAISVALKRKSIKISVGGINDEAEITGHRRAYVGAAPGKIISGIRRVGVNNPVFIIDEIDKMTKDIKGDPASSLLEVLDKEQNDKFIDHFIEEEFDLSNVMFILTANYIDKIPTELRDRLEIIELSSYTTFEKLSIAKNYILKKLEEEFKISAKELNIKDETILKIINNYTKESGVRELERLMKKICRKYICHKLINDEKIDINDNLIQLLGREKYSNQNNYDNDVGVINAVSYNPLGGQLVKVECASYPGTGRVSSSGGIGEIIKETVDLSMAYLKVHAKELDIKMDILNKNDYYIHFPCSSVKKDGPSAGCVILTSLLSVIKNVRIPKNIALTGEITLTGKIIKIGGLKEKIIAAITNGIDTIIVPKDNHNDILELSDTYKKNINVIYVNNYMDVYKYLFESKI